MNLRATPLLVLVLLPLLMGFSKKPKFTISFHAQADEMDPKKMMFPMQMGDRQVLFKLIPEVSQQNVVAFHPFTADTGDKGVALQFDFRGRGAVEQLTRTHKGEYLLAMVNGKPVDYVVIDRVIENGLLTVWRGVPDETIKQMEKKYPHINPGGAPTMSQNMEMMPTTKTEKKKALLQAKEATRAAEKARKAGKPETPAIPRLDPPGAPVTNSIPLEGGTANPAAPPKATSVQEPPLPKP